MRKRRKLAFVERHRIEDQVGRWAEIGIPLLESGAVLPDSSAAEVVQQLLRSAVVGLPGGVSSLSLNVTIPDELLPRANAIAAARQATLSEVVYGAALLGAEKGP